MNDKEKITSNEEDIIYIQRVLQGDKNEFEYIINSEMQIISYIEDKKVIEKILRHLG